MCCIFHLFCRISPKSRDARSNEEEHAGEDEDVQAERIRTATALNTSIEEVGTQVAKWVNGIFRSSGTEVDWCAGFCLESLEFSVCVHAVVSDSATPWTAARQAPLSMGVSRQEHWSGLPFYPPGDLPDPGIEPVLLVSSALQAGSLPLNHLGNHAFM